MHAVSDSLIGPYVDKGLCWPNDAGGRGHNVTALALPDGRYAIVISETRPCEIYVSKSLDGPWEHFGTITAEGDPRWHASNVSTMARPDGNFEFVLRDGIHDWTNRGLAYDPREAIVRYPDGTVNHWNKAERPSVYIESGHVAAMTLAVIDVEKELDKGNDGHGSKVIVIPFDGGALDRDLQSTSESPKP